MPSDSDQPSARSASSVDRDRAVDANRDRSEQRSERVNHPDHPCEVIADVLGDAAGLLSAFGKDDLAGRLTKASGAVRRAPVVGAKAKATYEQSSIPRLGKLLKDSGFVTHRTPPAYAVSRNKP